MTPIFVTQPSLPPLDEFTNYLKQIWDKKWLTNNGEFHQEFEKTLANYLGVKYISLFSNGTLALMIALRALELKGEVITTPFSFVATSHALWWNGIKPVFCDIDPFDYNLDPDKIEIAITSETTAILPVHIYGYPCNVEKIQKIADKHGLKVIYDACHAFGVNINDKSVLNFGDLSVLSFHATKVFNTFEGGAIICHNEKTKQKIDFLKNFGFADEITIIGTGINAKMNEFQAALGLLQLKYIDNFIELRKKIIIEYRKLLANIPGLYFNQDTPSVKHNYFHFPVLIDENEFGKSRDTVYEELKTYNIFTRRYFYPLISHFSPYRDLPSASSNNLPIAERITKQILCLPVYPDLSLKEVEFICECIKKIKNNG